MAAAKLIEQARARELRALGWSLRRIANELGASSGSVSVWVRDVVVPQSSQVPPASASAEPPARDAGGSRRCSRCEITKPLTEFNRHKNGHQWWCRECFRGYFRERGELHLRQVKSAKVTRLAAARAHIMRHFEAHPCADCGEQDPLVLEFDHIGMKGGDVSNLVSAARSVSALQAELERCEVVCVNCHRARTATRGGWRRARPDWRTPSETRSPHEDRNIVRALEVLERSGCVDCGWRDLRALDFDHLGDKIDSVTRLAAGGCSLARLEAEIAKCAVRCGNCHRRRTATMGGYWRARPKLQLPP